MQCKCASLVCGNSIEIYFIFFSFLFYHSITNVCNYQFAQKTKTAAVATSFKCN